MLWMNRSRPSPVCLLAIVWVLLIALSAANATEYFVAKNGNDQNNGRSERSAFATIKKGVSVLTAGDLLTILPGTYYESVSAQISGKPGSPITIRARRQGTVLLRGDVDALRFRRVEGLRFTYCADFAQRVEGIAERGTFRMYEPMLTIAEVEMNLATFYQDPQAGRLYVHASDSGDPNHHALSIFVTNGFGILLTPPEGSQTVHNVIVDGLSFTGYQARAGDTVLIHKGKYEEYVLVRATGDKNAPITFRAAPGETVWMEGSDRFRTTAFRLAAKHHIHIDGIRFRHFRYVPHAGDVINITGGANHVIRRCFYDGREVEGYMPNFIRATDTAKLLVENCVMIAGMGEGLVLSKCPEAIVRNCVFYNNFIRALTAWQFDPNLTITLTHNLFCDTIPEKTNNAFIRLSHLECLRSDHNGYFARKGPAERRILEAANVGGKPVGFQGPGMYHGANFLLHEVQQQTGQEKGSFFGNPGLRIVKDLLPSASRQGEWRQQEMHWDGAAFKPCDFADFFPTPGTPFTRAEDGQPVGLNPEAFR